MGRWIAWVAIAALSSASIAVAEDATVYLKNGGMVRGEIVVYLPNDHLQIVVDGESMRFDAEDITRVEVDDAKVNSTSISASGETGRQIYRPRAPDMQLYRMSTQGSPKLLCAGGCELHLSPGTYSFAISRFGRDPIPVEPVTVGSESILTATYRNKAGIRTFGWILAGAGVVATVTGIVAVALNSDSGFNRSTGKVGIIPPGVVCVGVGLVLVFAIRDRATLGVVAPDNGDQFRRVDP